MSVFDQRGQQVTYQYNAAGDINFGAVVNKVDLVGELEKLKAELKKAQEAGVVDEETALDADHHIQKAVIQAKKPEPDKKSMLDYLNTAKSTLEQVAALGGLVTGLAKAAELAQRLF